VPIAASTLLRRFEGFSSTTMSQPPRASSLKNILSKLAFITDCITNAKTTSEIIATVMPVRNLFAKG